MLKGTKVHLRLVREFDLDDYVRHTQNLEALGDYFPLELRSEVTIRQSFQEHGYWSGDRREMLMVDPETDRMIGLIAARKTVSYHESMEIGYILHDISQRGKGITVEAVVLFSDYLFRWLNIPRIQITALSENMASRRTAEKAGYTREGTLRHCFLVEGKARDLECYSLLREEMAGVLAQAGLG
jgi:RimJ/RimL family protein N-acetyltransferase